MRSGCTRNSAPSLRSHDPILLRGQHRQHSTRLTRSTLDQLQAKLHASIRGRLAVLDFGLSLAVVQPDPST